MGKKKTHILRYSTYALIGILCLGGGVLYARFQKEWTKGVLPNQLWSQIINGITNSNTPPSMSPEKIQARIDQLELEIVEETNDPDRALQLRREVQNLRTQLQTASEIK